MYGGNDFAEISKNLTRYKSETNFVGLLSNNYIERLNIDDKSCKKF